MTLTTKTLNRQVRNAVSNGQLDRDALVSLRKSVLDYAVPVQKRFIYVCALFIFLPVIFAAMSISRLSSSGATFDPVFFLEGIIPPTIFIVAFLAFLGYVSFGRIKNQYNKALKKGYPELYQELKA